MSEIIRRHLRWSYLGVLAILVSVMVWIFPRATQAGSTTGTPVQQGTTPPPCTGTRVGPPPPKMIKTSCSACFAPNPTSGPRPDPDGPGGGDESGAGGESGPAPSDDDASDSVTPTNPENWSDFYNDYVGEQMEAELRDGLSMPPPEGAREHGGPVGAHLGDLRLRVSLIANGPDDDEEEEEEDAFGDGDSNPGGGDDPDGGGGGGGLRESDMPSFHLEYNSQVAMNRVAGNWWFPYDIFVVVQPNGDLHLFRPGRVADVYQWDIVTGSFVSPVGAFDQMTATGSGWQRTTKTGAVWQFNSGGHLTSIMSRYGIGYQFNRNAQQAITSIVDYAGRTTSVTYNAQGYISSVTDWANRSTSMTYTAQGYLATITYPASTFYDRDTSQVVTRGKTLTFSYTTGTGTVLDGNLTSYTDDRSQTAFSVGYDSSDKATSVSARGQTWNITYYANSTKVVDPDGVTVMYTFDASGSTIQKEVYTRTGLGLPPLRAGEPNSYVWQYQRNAPCGCGLVTKITHPDSSTTSYSYDNWGNLLSRVDAPALGGTGATITSSWTYSSFAQFSRLLTHTTPTGFEAGAVAADHTYTHTYNSLGSLIQTSYPKVNVSGVLQHPIVTFTRNTIGQVVTRTSPSGRVDSYSYNANTNTLASITRDSVGFALTTSFGYDNLDRRTSITTPAGRTLTRTFNPIGLLVEVQPPLPLGGKTTWLYDNNDAVYKQEVENKDASGAQVSSNPWITYTTSRDMANRLVSFSAEIDASTTATTSFEHTLAGRPKKITDSNGDVVEIEYDERGLPFKATAAPGTSIAATTKFNYDLVGRVSDQIDTLNRSTSFVYDHAGRLLETTFADSTKAQVTYDAAGRVIATERQNAAGVALTRTTWSFDPMGRVLKQERHHLDTAGSTTSKVSTLSAYDVAGRVVSRTDPLGNATSIAYDTASRVSSITDAALNRAEFTYGSGNGLTERKQRDWNQVTSSYNDLIFEYSYDSLGRAYQSTRRDAANTLSSTASSQFDSRGRVTKTTDANGNTQHYTWNERGQLLVHARDIRAGGIGSGLVTSTIVTSRLYDVGGRLTSRVDGKSQATSYEYDARSRLKKETNAAGGVTIVTYDLVGNVATVTQPVGTVVSNTYDSLNRLVSRSATLAAGVVGDTSLTVSYDALGRTTQMSDNDHTTTRTYDSLSRMLTETQQIVGQSARTFTYGYDAANLVVSVTFPDGTVEQRTRDNIGRLSAVAIQGGPTLASYQYAGPRVQSLSLPNGVTRTKSFDALLRNTIVEYKNAGASIRKFEYGFDLSDNRLYEKRHHAGGTGDNYVLDSLYRTITAKAGVADPVLEHQTPGSQAVASSTTTTYDKAQSRTQVATTVGGSTSTTSYSSDAVNFYTTVGGTPHTRDANGSLVDDGTYTYGYDYRNQLVQIVKKSDSSIVASYKYDAVRRRSSKSSMGAASEFYWMGARMVMVYDSVGVVSRRHLGADGEVVAASHRDISDLDGDGQTLDVVLLTPMYDGARDCVGVLGPVGAVAESYTHTYDGTRTVWNAGGTVVSSSAVGWYDSFGGLYSDVESGLLYAVNRYYDPDQARFLNQDPVGMWFDTANLGNGYGFAANSYRNVFDDFGLKGKKNDAANHVGYIGLMASRAAGSDDGETHTDRYGDHSTPDLLNALATIQFDVTFQGRIPGWEAVTTTVDRKKYFIAVSYVDWKTMPFHRRVFLMIHEMLHAALDRCGSKQMALHHVTDKEYVHYQHTTLRILRILRKADPRNQMLISDAEMAELEANYAKD